jgi:hypothetical protein
MAADPKVGRVIGRIDSGGVRFEGEAYYVFGWACAQSITASLRRSPVVAIAPKMYRNASGTTILRQAKQSCRHHPGAARRPFLSANHSRYSQQGSCRQISGLSRFPPQAYCRPISRLNQDVHWKRAASSDPPHSRGEDRARNRSHWHS